MTATTVRSFFDTNILVYADSSDEGNKQHTAAHLLRRHMVDRTGVLSTQVLQEYVSVGLRKLALPPDLIRQRLMYFGAFEMVPTTPKLIADALDLHQVHQLSFWDALVVQAARQSGCVRLVSEDMNAGAIIAGVRIVNPFSEST